MDIMIFREGVDIKSELEKFDSGFIKFDKPKNLEEVLRDKWSLKMLNGENHLLIANSEFLIVGLAVNRKKYSVLKQRIKESLRKKNNKFLQSYFYFVSSKLLEFTEEQGIRNKIINSFNIKSDKLKNILSNSKNKMKKADKYFEQYRELYDDAASFVYIEIDNREMKVFLENTLDNYLSYHSNQWKLKSFYILKFLIIEKFYIENFLGYITSHGDQASIDVIENIIENIDAVAELINNLNRQKKGTIIAILNTTEFIPEKLLLNRERESLYKEYLMNNGQKLEVKRYNFSYLNLIAQIDGALILDKDFKLLSFGELINLDISKELQIE